MSGSGLDAPDLSHCDVVYFAIGNKGDKPIDVTPLYVDGAGGIAYVGPGEGLRVVPGEAPRVVPIPKLGPARGFHSPIVAALLFADEAHGRGGTLCPWRGSHVPRAST